MSVKHGRVFRCAIYTRKSTEHGLELEFNSLDAQREACEAYIKSQASQGWQGLSRHYDDPAYSGGNMDRPALQKLLRDIEAGQIDVVVVYKIDRLTRSLADFAKLVEIFDKHSVSFVAVTQQFNTTTSMGRLTLNVLLSFAQFERELSSERVRDKVAASRRKGIWTGGSVPLGYDSKDKKLVVNEGEAKTVRLIFARYLALKSFQKLVDELNQKGVVSKKRPISGRNTGGVPFMFGSLAYLLKNRTYLGETGHAGKWYPGEHQPILDRRTFDQVQRLLKDNTVRRHNRRHQSGALLGGLLFDDRGNRMSPSFSVKNGIRYKFYVSLALLKGRRANAGSVTRVSAGAIEDAVIQAVRGKLSKSNYASDKPPRTMLDEHVDRIVVGTKKITITLKPQARKKAPPIEIPWSASKKSGFTKVEAGNTAEARAPNPQLVQAVVRAHIWLRSLAGGTHETIESLARSINIHPKIVRNAIRMAYLAPELTKAVLEGRQPRAWSLNQFKNEIPFRWSAQMSGLPS